MPSKSRPRSTDNEVKAYKRRYEEVNRREIEELRKTPLDIKYRQFWMLLRWAEQMGWQIMKPDEIAQVRKRWTRLRRAHGQKKKAG